jgi:succinate dehydrogenase / fumarate reductase flavoprotein subunit
VDAAAERAVRPFDPQGGGVEENPYTLHSELQQSMNDLVGIIRKAGEIRQALAKIEEIKGRIANIAVEGHRQFNPGWHLAIDMYNMILVSECVARAALLREESRGGHTRDDHPAMAANWRNRLLVCSTDGEQVAVEEEPQIPMREELFGLFDVSELEKYYTPDEVAAHPGRKA